MDSKGFLAAVPRGRLAPAILTGLVLAAAGSLWEPAASRLASSLTGGDPLPFYLVYLSAMLVLALVSVVAGLRLGSPPEGGSGVAGLVSVAGLVAAWLGLGGLLYGFSRAPLEYTPGTILLILAYAALALHLWGLTLLALPLAGRGLMHEAAGLAGLYSMASLAGYEGYLALTGEPSLDSVAVYLVGRAAPAFALGASIAYVSILSGWALSALYSIASLLLLTVAPVTPSGGLLELGFTTVAALYAAPLAGYAAARLEVMAYERPGLAAALTLAAVALVAAALLVYSSGVMIWRPVAVVTGSMEPAIERGDLVILERVSLDEVKVGDVVAFRINSTVVVHRVIEKGEGYLVTKGDANESPDPYRITDANLLGRVAYVLPEAGWPIILMNWSPEIRLAVILVLAAILLVAALRLL